METTYVGERYGLRSSVSVHESGVQQLLEVSSVPAPTGWRHERTVALRHDWGNGSCESAQLAWDLLFHHLGDEARAYQLFLLFFITHVVALPVDGWTMTAADIDAWIARYAAAAKTIDDERRLMDREDGRDLAGWVLRDLEGYSGNPYQDDITVVAARSMLMRATYSQHFAQGFRQFALEVVSSAEEYMAMRDGSLRPDEGNVSDT